MRRNLIVAALIGACTGSLAFADPFDHLPGRLQQYQEQLDAGSTAQPVPSTTVIPHGAEVVPTPMPHDGAAMGYYPGHGMWHEPAMGREMCCERCQRSCGTYWGRAEYMLWWVQGANTPPLVTTSPQGTPVGEAGVLPNADILFGNQRVNTDVSSGGRFTLGYWFDQCESLGIEDTFFFIGEGNDSFSASSTGSPILARPFFNTETQAQDAILLAFPATVVGLVDVNTDRTVISNGLNLRRNLISNWCSRLDVLAGYRFFYLGESLDVTTQSTLIDGGQVPDGTAFDVRDSFTTRNHFHGAQLALNYQRHWGCWTLDVLGKLAIGGVRQRVMIDGSTVRTIPNQDPDSFEGGILALPSNIGSFGRSEFGVLPELNVNLRYQLSELWTVSFGYTLLGLTNVVRPGDQIDLRLDPAQFPPGVPGNFPQFAFDETDVWVQGINFGVECYF